MPESGDLKCQRNRNNFNLFNFQHSTLIISCLWTAVRKIISHLGFDNNWQLNINWVTWPAQVKEQNLIFSIRQVTNIRETGWPERKPVEFLFRSVRKRWSFDPIRIPRTIRPSRTWGSSKRTRRKWPEKFQWKDPWCLRRPKSREKFKNFYFSFNFLFQIDCFTLTLFYSKLYKHTKT